MKNLKYIMFLISLLVVSCSKSEVSSVDDTVWKVEGNLAYDNMTKVGVNGNSLFWQKGDQVVMRAFGESSMSEKTVLNLNIVDSGLSEAKFKGEVEMTERPKICTFAYPSTASIESDGAVVFDYSVQDGSHRPFLYGSASYDDSGIECTLNHAGSLIRLSVPEGVTKVQVSGNNGEKISKVKVDAAGNVTATDDALSSYEIVVVSGSTSYIYVPSLTLERGFSLICSHDTKGKLIKSYSTDGKSDSGYEFVQGKVLDINLSEAADGDYFKAWCTVKADHTYKDDSDKTLTGTQVDVTSFGFSGAPAKVIDQWGVALYDGETLVRWAYGDGLFADSPNYVQATGKVPMDITDYDGSWPLLVPGKEYSVHAICNVNGVNLDFIMDEKITVDDPEIKVTAVSGKTSWTYYNAGNSAANAKDNDAIFEVSVSVNVDKEIINNSNYDFWVTLSTDGSSTTKTYDFSYNSSSSFTTSASELVWDGLPWGTRTIDAEVSFAEESYSSKTSGVTATCHITGLPYTAGRGDNVYEGFSDNWTAIGSGVTKNVNYFEFDASGIGMLGSAKNGGVISPVFKVPNSETINVTTAINATGKNVSSWGDDPKYLNFYIASGNTNSSVAISGNHIVSNYYGDLAGVTSETAAAIGYCKKASSTEVAWIGCSLSQTSPCIVYSTSSKTHNKALHQVSIQYAF